MQRGLGDSVGGGSEGQDGGPGGFQSVVQSGDDLISWDGDLSAGGPSDGIPQVTEGRDNLPGPSRAEFNQVVRERDRALQQCEEMFRALQLASQAMSEHKMVEPSPNHGRDRNSILLDDLDKPDVLGIGTSPRDKPSRESHSVEDFCPGRVRTSCAPEAGSGEARSGSQAHVTINEFGPCGPRASYSQPNISPGVEFRENGKEPTGCWFNEQFPTYHCRDDFVQTSDVDARSRGYYATGSPIDRNVVVQGSPVRPSQTDNVDTPHIATANVGNRFHRKQKEPDKFDGDKVEWADFIAHFNVVARWNDWTYSEKGLQLATCLRGKAQKVLSSIPESLNGDYETVRSTLEKRFNPPHRENAFRAVFRRRKWEARESLMDYGSDVMRLAQRAYPGFSYDALDQVAREQFISGLSDIEMKRFVDLRGPHSLEEAVSLATQFESFELSENSPGLNRWLEAKGKTRSAPVQAATEMPSSIESQFSKFISAFEKRMAAFDRKMAALDARLDAMKAGSKEPEQKFAPGNNYARQLKSPPRGRLGNCYGCGQPGHFKRNCAKLRARTKPQRGNTKKEPRQASGRDQRPQYSRARPVQGSNRNQPGLPSRAGSDSSDEPWRQDSLWKCAVKGCDHPGSHTFLALEKHFMRWHQSQRVEYVCPFGGYCCPLQPCSAHNPEPSMIRRHTKRHHRGEAGRERAATELPYVVVDNPEMKDPGDLPRFPRNPQSGAPLRDWPFSLQNAGPQWTTESMRGGWVPPSHSRRAPPEPSQSRESDETVGEEPPQEPPTRGSAGSQSRNVRPIHKHSQEVRMSSSDDGDFLVLEERMSFEEDVAPQEPLVQQELQGAQGGQDVALQGPQPELLETD